jgi:hypothetical protein
MANKNTSNKRRRPGRKAEDIHTAWKELAPTAVFAGITLAEFEAIVTSHTEARQDMHKSKLAWLAAKKAFGDKTTEVNDQLTVIVRGVQGHAEYGEDSPLYRAMGFVPKSERRSGLTRRPAQAPANNEAAA